MRGVRSTQERKTIDPKEINSVIFSCMTRGHTICDKTRVPFVCLLSFWECEYLECQRKKSKDVFQIL